ncbi:MAG: carboxylesterase family protein [Myxococcota bacterium]
MPLLVDTRFGRVHGRLDRGVTVFRGVPYAAAPVAALRFQPPARLEPWSGVLDCRDPGPAAPQNAPRLALLAPSTTAPARSEDCLRLDLSTAGFDGLPRPVLVFVHGGAFAEGAAADPGTRGRRLARGGDLVVISLQHRLGALGFLDPAELPPDAGLGAANLGLLDLIAALEWVRKEVDAFGGDPHNVTLFGEGSGATAVACLLAAKSARGLFQRAILASGSLRIDTRESSTRRTREFLGALGLEAADARKLADLPVAALLAAQARAGGFRPTIDAGLLDAAPLDAARAGTLAPLPVLIGSNRDETRVLELEDPEIRRLDREGIVTRLRERGLEAAQAKAAVAAYTSLRSSASPAELFHAIETDRCFRIPALRLAESIAAAGAPAYVYEFAFSGVSAQGPTGAFHGLEQPFVFGTRRIHALGPLIEDGAEAKALSRRMREAWTAFTRSGNPRSPLVGPWPAYTAPDRATLVFDADTRVEHAPRDAERRFWDGSPRR